MKGVTSTAEDCHLFTGERWTTRVEPPAIDLEILEMAFGRVREEGREVLGCT